MDDLFYLELSIIYTPRSGHHENWRAQEYDAGAEWRKQNGQRNQQMSKQYPSYKRQLECT